MKQSGVLIFISICFFSFKIDGGKIRKGNFNSDEIKFIKTNYKWSSEEFLIINFRQPKFKCHYDSYNNVKKINKAINNFYSEIETKSIKIIAVSSEKEKILNTIDNKTHFGDLNNFFTYQVFVKDYSCYGLLVIKNDGNYLLKAGEYITEDIESFLNQLK